MQWLPLLLGFEVISEHAISSNDKSSVFSVDDFTLSGCSKLSRGNSADELTPTNRRQYVHIYKSNLP